MLVFCWKTKCYEYVNRDNKSASWNDNFFQAIFWKCCLDTSALKEVIQAWCAWFLQHLQLQSCNLQLLSTNLIFPKIVLLLLLCCTWHTSNQFYLCCCCAWLLLGIMMLLLLIKVLLSLWMKLFSSVKSISWLLLLFFWSPARITSVQYLQSSVEDSFPYLLLIVSR